VVVSRGTSGRDSRGDEQCPGSLPPPGELPPPANWLPLLSGLTPTGNSTAIKRGSMISISAMRTGPSAWATRYPARGVYSPIPDKCRRAVGLDLGRPRVVEFWRWIFGAWAWRWPGCRAGSAWVCLVGW
jgi:hypothetical protein